MTNPNVQAKNRLQSLFGGKEKDNDNGSLRYTAPKASAMNTASSPAPAASNILASASLNLYEFNASTKSYMQLDTNAVGCVIMGENVSYTLLCYNAQKTTLCTIAISCSLRCTLQANAYVNVNDEGTKKNYSMKFRSENDAQVFYKQMCMVKLHVGIWGKSGWSSSEEALLKADVKIGNKNATAVQTGTSVGIGYSAWKIVGSISANPLDLNTKYAPFEATKEDEVSKFKIGDKGARFKAIENGVIGMVKGGKRLIVSPPKVSARGEWLLFEVELLRTKSNRSNSVTNVPAVTQSKAPKKKTSSPNIETATSDVIIPAERNEQSKSDQQSKIDLELEQLRLAKEQFALQQMQFSQQSMVNTSSGVNSFPMQTNTNGMTMPNVSSDVNGKLEYIIQMLRSQDRNSHSRYAPGSMSGSAAASSAIRAIERMGADNEQYSRELASQASILDETEGRMHMLSERLNTMSHENQQLSDRLREAQGHLVDKDELVARAISARETVSLQASRLEHELEELRLNLDHQYAQSNENHEYEHQSRTRLENELQVETQARTLAEQQLALLEKQFEMDKKVMEADLLSSRQEDLKTNSQRVQALEEYASKAKQRILELTPLQDKVASLQQNVNEAMEQLQLREAEISKLKQVVYDAETALQEYKNRNLAPAIDPSPSDNFKQSHEEKIEEMKKSHAAELEALKHASPAMSNDVHNTMEEALRLKSEAEALLSESKAKTNDNASSSIADVFKERMNSVYFKFQDSFEEEESYSTAEIITIIRKTLKQSTKDALAEMNE